MKPIEEQPAWPNAYTTVETGVFRRVLDLLELEPCLLKQLIETIEAHEVTCFTCDRDGEEYCDCLKRQVNVCSGKLAEIEQAKHELRKELE